MKRINFPWRFFLLHLAFSGIILFFIAGCDNIQANEEEDLTAFLALTNASQNGAPGEAFYTPPSPLPEGDHGDLISYRQTDVVLPGAPNFASWLVLYHSTDALGAPNAVTGTVILPLTRWTGSGRRPIVSYAVGTHGLSHEWAPSKQLANGTDYENSNIVAALNSGYAVLVTDNPGYTDGDIPTYMSGIAQGHAVLDIITAALQIPYIPLSENAKIAIWGYSQGGQSASFAGELQPSYAPDLNLAGVAAGGVPADFFEVARYLDGNNGSSFLLETVIGLWSQYPEGIPLEELMNAEGEAAIEKGLSMGVFEALFEFMNTSLSTFAKGGMSLEALMGIPSVNQTLTAQALGNSAIKAPVFLYHGTADEFIPLEQALVLREKYNDLGVKTAYMVFSGEHITTQFQAAPFVLSWLQDRFDGVAVTGSSEPVNPRPVSTANPVDGDFIFSLNQWTLDATMRLNTLNQDVDMPGDSTFTAETNMTTNTITGTMSIPKFPAPIWVILPLKVRLEIIPTEPMSGTASLDNAGQLHVHGHAYVTIKIKSAGLTNYTGIPIGLRTEEPVDFAIDFDGPVSSLGDGTLTFSGETTFPTITGGALAPLFTALMSGPGQEYSFTVLAPEPTAW
ncbi:MAG TPA: alpha/beta fold hydrolase [Spirochaetota bacterium]|nr:alpha/beta fold hydrolase [Spirochaetota bacterium]